MAPDEYLNIEYGRHIPTDLIVGSSLGTVLPAIGSWWRLEAMPYTPDLEVGLRAEIADPLWMLARQWQFAEFRAEDAGSPILVRLNGEAAPLSRYLPGGPGALPISYRAADMPLEVLVEQEAVRSLHPKLAAEAGEHFLRLMAQRGVAGVRQELRERFALEIPDEAIMGLPADPKGKTWRILFAGRALDGAALASELQLLTTPQGALTRLPDSFAFAAGREKVVMEAAEEWLRWYAHLASEPEGGLQNAWIPQRQEYSLSIFADFQNGESVRLEANEYTDGRLDWYSFTATSALEPSVPTQAVPAELPRARPLWPSPVRYPGMPADRYWEFEDERVDLGNLEAGPTDLARMLIAEYGLVFGNDWFLIPVELPVGSVFRVTTLVVQDTFGQTTNVGPARNLDGTRWTMFHLTSRPPLSASLEDLFFLPPVLPHRLQGDPLEEVALFRDETANMAWAVERKIQGASGETMDRRMEPPAPSVYQRIDGADISAELVYRLMTPVPDRWLPFVPVPRTLVGPLQDFSIGLERRALLRRLRNGGQTRIHPRGLLLRADLRKPVAEEPPLRIFEEEVPREGIVVDRSFQYARWTDGQCYLWVGRQKRRGRGEGSSGLRFDASYRTSTETSPEMPPVTPTNE